MPRADDISLPLRSEPHAVLGDRVAAAASGDSAASADVLTYLLPRVRNLVRYLVRRDLDIDDITQDALVALLRGLPTFRHDGTVESWADRVVARCTFSFLRRRRAVPNLAALDSETLRDATPFALGGDEYLLRRRAVAALDDLPSEQRDAFVLHHIVEMSIAEVAVEVEAPAETVRSRIRLAKLRLRKQGWTTPEMYNEAWQGKPKVGAL